MLFQSRAIGSKVRSLAEPGGAFCSPAPLGPPLVRFSRPGRGEDMTGLGGHMRGFPAAAAWFPS